MADTSILLIILASFFLAGTVKGVIGMGLPTVSLSILTIALDLTSAMALLLAPSLVTNIWQAIDGNNIRQLLVRLWVFLSCATLFIWIGGLALSRIQLPVLSMLLGLLLGLYAIINMLGFRTLTKPSNERWAGPLAGCINGALGGMTGSFVFPGVLYLQSLGLSRDQLIQAMGILFSVSTIMLGLSLIDQNLLTNKLAWQSSLGVLPALLGMLVGKKVRGRLSENTFKKCFFMSILLMAVFIVLRALPTQSVT